eukprot:Em0007g1274a
MDEIRQHFWKKGTLIHNSKALKDGVYLKLGQLIAMAVVHSEIHTNLMGKPVYEYLSGRSLCSLKLQNITDEEQMHNFQIEHYEFLVEAGVMSTTLADKTSNLNELCLHSAILRSVAEIQQLAAGLKTLCVIDALEMYPSLMESYFIKSETAMTAAELRSTFIVTYSEDVDVRLKEEIALTYFDEYMEKCAVDGGKMSSCEEQPGRNNSECCHWEGRDSYIHGAPGSPDTAGEIGDTEEAGPAGAPGLFGVDGAAGLDGAPGTTGVMIVVSRGQSLTWSTWYHCSVDSGVKRAKPHREHLEAPGTTGVLIVVSKEGKASQRAPGTTGVAMVVSRRQSKYQEGEM